MVKFKLIMAPKILVVDDEKTIRDLFREYLGEEGFLVETASSGQAALELINKEKFDLLLIDLIMPEMDGLELLRQVREGGSGAAAAILTAYEVELDKAREEFLNITAFIPKGIPMAEISEKINGIFKGEKENG